LTAVVVGPVGLVGKPEACPQIHRDGRPAASGGQELVLVERAAVAAVAGKAAGPVKDRKRAVWIGVDAPPHLDETRPERGLRDLKAQAAIAPGVVVADHPLLLHAQDVAMDAGGVRDEGGLGVIGRTAKRALCSGR
jgi:hypothetical protein